MDGGVPVSLKRGLAIIGGDGLSPFLYVALGLLAATQIWAGLSLRGLYADGSYYAARLWLAQSFVVIEPSRLTAQVLMQAPVVLAMRLGVTSPHAVALLFSLSTNLIPLLLTGCALLILPQRLHRHALVPFFVFLTGGMSAAFASIADGPCAAAYCALLFLLVTVAPLSPIRLGLILLLALGCLRLHEAMAFLGPLLVLACLLRMGEARGYERGVLILAALLIAAGSLQAGFDILHPRMPGNRASFLTGLMGLSWLWSSGGANILAIAGLAAVFVLPLGHLPGRCQTGLRPAAFILFALLVITAWMLPATPGSAFAARGNACLIAAAAFALFLAARHFGWPADGIVPFATLILVGLAVTLTIGNLRADLDWMRYREAMQMELHQADGPIDFPLSPPVALQRCTWPWTSPLMSLWLAPGPRIRSLLLNKPGSGWQPFDPATLTANLPLPLDAALAMAFRR